MEWYIVQTVWFDKSGYVERPVHNRTFVVIEALIVVIRLVVPVYVYEGVTGVVVMRIMRDY